MQRELRRLAHGTDEQADADHGHQQPACARHGGLLQLWQLGKDFAVVQRARVGRNQTDAQDEAEVTHTVDQEGLHVGEDGRFLLEVETDQQVGHQAHSLPAEEQLQQVVAHHQHQHGEGEQRDVGEETVVAVVFFHVAHGVDVHHQRHEGHHAHHHGGDGVDQETDLHLQTADHHPFIDGLIKACALGNHCLEGQCRQDEGNQHAQDGERVADSATELVATKCGAEYARQDRTGQRSQRYRQEHGCRKCLTHSSEPCKYRCLNP